MSNPQASTNSVWTNSSATSSTAIPAPAKQYSPSSPAGTETPAPATIYTPPQKLGRLKVTSNPAIYQCSVYLDGEGSKPTPYSKEHSFGRYKLRVCYNDVCGSKDVVIDRSLIEMVYDTRSAQLSDKK